MEQSNVNEADVGYRSPIMCKLTTCKCQELHAPGKQPGRRAVRICTKEKEECCIVLRLERNKGTSFAHHQLLVVVPGSCLFAQADFDFFVGF